MGKKITKKIQKLTERIHFTVYTHIQKPRNIKIETWLVFQTASLIFKMYKKKKNNFVV